MCLSVATICRTVIVHRPHLKLSESISSCTCSYTPLFYKSGYVPGLAHVHTQALASEEAEFTIA